MNKIFGLLLITLFSTLTFAQVKTIEKSDFDKVRLNSYNFLYDTAYRETFTEQSKFEVISATNQANGSPLELPPRFSSMKITTENLFGKYRMVFESDSPKTKKETIGIKKQIYTRDSDGEWTEKTYAPQPKREPRYIKKDSQISYKFLGYETLNNQKTSVYQTIETSKSINSVDNRETDWSETDTFWFAEDGRLLKTEASKKLRGEKIVSTIDSTKIYEWDSSIKIEAPTIEETAKQ